MNDLFGNPITPAQEKAEKRKAIPNGYAARPGSGPAGETCKTCLHNCRTGSGTGKKYVKCDIIKHRWTASYGTDIRLKSPACSFWKSMADKKPF